MVKIKCPHSTIECSHANSSGHGSCYHDRCPPKKAGQPQSVDGTNDDLCWLLRTATSEYGSPLTVRLLVAFNPLRWRRCTPKKKSECTRSLIPGSERTVGNTSNSAVLLEVRLLSCDVLVTQATCDEQVQTPTSRPHPSLNSKFWWN